MAYFGSNVLSTFGAVPVGCIVYLVVLLLIGGMLEEDVARIPMIGKVGIKTLRRLGIFKGEAAAAEADSEEK